MHLGGHKMSAETQHSQKKQFQAFFAAGNTLNCLLHCLRLHQTEERTTRWLPTED